MRATVFSLFAIVLGLLGATSARPTTEKYTRTVESYVVPDVTLVNQDGENTRFREFLDSDKPVVLDFIYCTCTTVCPVQSATFSRFQRDLGDRVEDKATLVSISIDPEHDTPRVMKEYLRKYRAKPGWSFLTGKREDIVQAMKAFDAYVSDKKDHYPLMILRAPGADQWVRIYGLLGAKDLMREYRKVVRD